MNETDPTQGTLHGNSYGRHRARLRFAAVTGAFGALLVFSIYNRRRNGVQNQR